MPDLTLCAVGEPRCAGPIGFHFPDIELVVQQHGLIASRPTGDAERRFVRARIVRFPVGEGCGYRLVTRRVPAVREVNGRVVLVLEIEEIAAARAHLRPAIFNALRHVRSRS